MQSDDIVTLLLADHQETRQQLELFSNAERSELDKLFSELADRLVRHEIAEEIVLYPVIAMEPGGLAVREARLSEQSETAQLLSEMEQMSTDSGEFAEAFETLRTAVLEHANSEEQFVFPLLKDDEQETLRAKMGRRYMELLASVPPAQAMTTKELARQLRELAPDLKRRVVPPQFDRARSDKAYSSATRGLQS